MRPQGHRSDRLDTAQAVNLVRSGEVLSRDDCRSGSPLVWRRAHVTILRTPATLAVMTDMWAEASRGYFPPGT